MPIGSYICFTKKILSAVKEFAQDARASIKWVASFAESVAKPLDGFSTSRVVGAICEHKRELGFVQTVAGAWTKKRPIKRRIRWK